MLIWSDLQATANSFVRRGARAPLIGTAMTLLLIGALSQLFGRVLVDAVLQRNEVLAHYSTAALFGLIVTPTSLVSIWFGLAACQRRLFEARELDLLLTAPLRPTRIVFASFGRVWLLTCVYSLALVGPTSHMLLSSFEAPGYAWGVLVGCIALATGAPLAGIIAVTIALLRWFAGRTIKILLTLLISALSLAFSLFLLSAAFGRERQAHAVLDLASGERPQPWMIEAAGNLMAASLGEPWAHDSVLRGLGSLALALLVLMFISRWHPGAVERSRLSERPPLSLGLGRPWPTRPIALLRRKEFARILQEPRQLFGLVLYGLMLVLAARTRLLIDAPLAVEEAPERARQVVAMLTLWFLGVLMALPTNFGRFVLGDGRQWDLYRSAPVRPRHLLIAKLQASAAILAWPWIVVAVIGATVLDFDRLAVGVYLALSLCGNALALAILTPIATLPLLVKPQDDGTTGQHGRTLLAVFGLILLFEVLVAVPGIVAWIFLAHRWEAGAPIPQETTLALYAIGAATAYATALTVPAWWLSRRNLRALLRPRKG